MGGAGCILSGYAIVVPPNYYPLTETSKQEASAA